MRRPIRTQLLTAMLSVAALAIALATATGVYLAVLAAERREELQLAGVKKIISEANFPLTESVLRQMHGLSGAQFVLLNKNRRAVRGTISPESVPHALLVSAESQTPADSYGDAAGPTAPGVVSLDGRLYRADIVPVGRKHKAANGGGSVLILFPKDSWWAMAGKAGWPSLASGALALLAGGLVAAFLAGRFVRPIRAIENQTKAIAAGRFDPVTVPAVDDEIADLAVSINLMAGRLSHYEKEVRAGERMRALGRLGAGIAHQLRNSATGARMAIELHRRECPAAASESTAVALRELELMEAYIGRFLELGKTQPLRRERVDLCRLVREVLKLVEPTCRHAGVEIVCRGRPAGGDAAAVIVQGDEQSLRQLLVNLVLNAVEAVERCGATRQIQSGDARIVVELEENADTAVLSVLDSGAGPGEAIRERLFEPFISGKPDGTGLGLYVARQVAEAHHGSISFNRREGMTCFCVEIPIDGVRGAGRE